MADRLSISVVIVTRNRADWLNDALTSLVKQSRPPDEVIVVDNDSSDNTKETILSFSGKLNLTYLHEPKRGIPHARNAGILRATGDIVAFIDDDCVADENWLKYIEIPFIKDPAMGVAGGEVFHYKMGASTIEEFYFKNMISTRRSKQTCDNTNII